jgi:hypothetical protein
VRTARANTHAALVRGDDNGLHVRNFATAEAANAAAQGNPSLDLDHEPAETVAAKAWKHTGSPTELSRRLNGRPSAQTITRLCRAGDLPCRDDGCGRLLPRYRLPVRAIVASVLAVGWRATLARHRAGILIA